MGRRMRSFDWDSTPVGSPERWPQSLRTVISIILHSRFPMFLFWGPELIQFYNDAYMPGLGDEGRQEAVLGKPAAGSWPDGWHIIKPLLDKVLDGEAVWMEDLVVPNIRQGILTDTFWTFGYTPVIEEAGSIAGVLVTCIETTEKVLSTRKLEESEQLLQQRISERTRELQDAQASLMEANSYLQSIINLFKEPMQVLRPVYENGEIVDFIFMLTNNAYAAYTTTTPASLEGHRVSEFFPNYFQTSSFTKVAEVFRSGVAETWEIHYNVDGLDIYNLMSATPFGEDVVVHFTDFTKLKNLQLELLSKIRELERSNAQLEEFANAASHDLKEPIRKIQIFTQQLKMQLSSRTNAEENRLLGKIENGSNRMAALVEDLLTYSYVSQSPTEKEEVPLRSRIDAAIEDLELYIKEKGAVIEIGELPTITGYQRQVQQLFQNLISNALKYSRENEPPLIRITSITTGCPPGFHCIAVADNGIGFEQEYAEKIFQIFTRLHAKHEYSGTGVGLSIVKKVVENHLGYIEVESEPGKGSVFRIYFPK